MFRLALSLGRTKAELLDSISYEELLEWGEYEQREAFGERVANFRAGLLASVIANVNRDPKSRPEPYEPMEFMPYERAERNRQEQYLAEQKQAQALEGEAIEEEQQALPPPNEETTITPTALAWLFAMGRKTSAKEAEEKKG